MGIIAKQVPFLSDKKVAIFWSRVRKSNECWEWQGTIENGYGRLCVQYEWLKVHRISWTLKFGAIPRRKLVLHRCDNKICVRPDHLFLGTQADNNKDRDTKGRTHSKLVRRQVLEILDLWPRNLYTVKHIASSYRVTPASIFAIVQRRTWKHITS